MDIAQVRGFEIRLRHVPEAVFDHCDPDAGCIGTAARVEIRDQVGAPKASEAVNSALDALVASNGHWWAEAHPLTWWVNQVQVIADNNVRTRAEEELLEIGLEESDIVALLTPAQRGLGL
jgi:hypothetical protein